MMTEMTPAHGHAPAKTEGEHARLLMLLGELLEENQELRFKVVQLEQAAARHAQAAAETAAVYGLLLP